MQVLIIGAGVFGQVAAAEARRRGHEPVLASRHSGRRVDADDEPSVRVALEDADGVLLAAGPFQQRTTATAAAAAHAGVPYADIADDAAFSQRLAAIPSDVPLLTGMSTAPAVAEALAALAHRRAPDAVAARATMWTGPGNRQGPATARFAVHAHLRARSERVVLAGRMRRAWPARAHFAPGLPSRFLVALEGVAALGWRAMPVLGPVLPRLTWLPRLSRDTGVALVVDMLDAAGSIMAREGLHADAQGQRMAVLPALWALEQARAGKAPPRGAQARDWVDAEALVAALVDAGFEHDAT